jgi:predicted metal-dependent enzyme (double-stranded beta helix superfamily)
VSAGAVTGPEWAVELAGRLPQSWRDVVSPPPDVAAEVEGYLVAAPPDVLDESHLAALVEHVAADDALWAPLVIADPARRRYRLAYEDERLDLWVLSWMPGQGTGFHDHGTSAVALTAVQGSVRERRLNAAVGPVGQLLEPGEIRTGRGGYIHAVEHATGLPAVTIHAYSPPLLEVGQYRASSDGLLWRELQHGRQELLDHTFDVASAHAGVTHR